MGVSQLVYLGIYNTMNDATPPSATTTQTEMPPRPPTLIISSTPMVAASLDFLSGVYGFHSIGTSVVVVATTLLGTALSILSTDGHHVSTLAIQATPQAQATAIDDFHNVRSKILLTDAVPPISLRSSLWFASFMQGRRIL